jgi:hypothetical protein
MDLPSLVTSFLAMAGFAAFIAIVINIGKAFHIVKDGTAANWSAALNLVGLVAFVVVKIVRPEFDWSIVDTQLGAIANVLTVLLSYIIQLLGSKLANFAVRTVPLIGKSYSAEG